MYIRKKKKKKFLMEKIHESIRKYGRKITLWDGRDLEGRKERNKRVIMINIYVL